jgi:hypothetical protein
MGGVWSDSFQVSPTGLTGDAPPAPDTPVEQETPFVQEPTQVASPLSNGYVAYPDGQRPAGFNGVCTVVFDHAKGINNLKIVMDVVDTWDDASRRNSRQLTFNDRSELVRNLNAHKGTFQNSFTVVIYDMFFYTFENFFNPVDIYLVPELRLSNGLELYNVYVVVEKPAERTRAPAPRRPLLARLWTKFIGESAQESEPEPDPQGEHHVSILWYQEVPNPDGSAGYITKTTTISDCHVIANEIDIP